MNRIDIKINIVKHFLHLNLAELCHNVQTNSHKVYDFMGSVHDMCHYVC